MALPVSKAAGSAARRASTIARHMSVVPDLLAGGWAMKRIPKVPDDHVLPERSLKGKTLFVTGASRGIGLAIALRAAQDGANVAIAAKTVEPHPALPGTIYTAAEDIEKAGGQALPVQCDIRSEDSVRAAIDATVDKFGGIDILVNNASAINTSDTESVEMKRYDLMHTINERGTFMCTKLCLPHLKKSDNAHVLTLAPPLFNLDEKWFQHHTAYTTSKYGMAMCVLGHSAEFRPFNIGVNALWPRTTIATAALQNVLGGDAMMKIARKPEIMADAAHFILTRRSDKCTGNFFVDDEVLASEGVRDLQKYKVDPTLPDSELCPDFFV
ncbi:short-chain dehydrogenase/reductase SDR [Salpingoeca rosetta]|uniref:Hydroxysteroid dehydrogenase-like protein 2 n=1 Tax=Salpingoeca rosetta (strain ATCC 50818 / BSB-021) TaxID=946362 RepID=F2U7C7_SALR5|nr:short-chain dehydrogenase/reductase SDR [Salpingoeca rosetta]EGD83344.1 short-chain dehydrogenase/reductase SDR [Salpingoeca rosetta]|eukprot:XP_004994848.1 short-chain dehydrogenase/reductase SDR [Salpingoeca rosetta]